MKRMNFTFLLLFALLSFVSIDLNAQANSSACLPEVNISVDAQCGFVVDQEVLNATGPAAMAESIVYSGPSGDSGTGFPSTGSITAAGANGTTGLGLPKGGGTVQYTLFSGPDGTGSMLCWGEINFEVKLTPEPVYAAYEVMCSVAAPDLPSLASVVASANGQCSAEISNITESHAVEGTACEGFRTIRKITGTVDIDGSKSPVVLRVDTIIETPLDTSMVTCPDGGPDFADALKLSCEDLGGAYPDADAVHAYFYAAYRARGFSHAAAYAKAVQKAYPYLDKGTSYETVIDDIITTVTETITPTRVELNGVWVLVDVITKDTMYETIYAEIPYPNATPLKKGTTCNLSIKCQDMPFPGCAGPESKIMRTWQVLDWCNGSIKECMQWIVVEPDAPAITSVTVNANGRNIAVGNGSVVGADIAPWICSAEVTLSATVDASCAPGYDLSWSTTAGAIVGNKLVGLWLDEPATVTATAISDCGSHGQIATVSFQVVAVDNILPQPVAEDEVNVTLTGDPNNAVSPDGGVAKVFVDAIDAGSHNAGCGEVSKCLLTKSELSNPLGTLADGTPIYAADSDCRVDGYLPAVPPSKGNPGRPAIPYVVCKEFVKFCCSDQGPIQVALVVSNGYRSAHSWTTVNVEDKSRSVFECSEGGVVACGQAYDPLAYAPIFQSAVCEASTLDYTVAGDQDACGNGADFITWTLDGEVICVTTIRYSGASAFNPYEIKWPKHYDGSTVPGVRRECEGGAIVEYADGVAMGAAFDCAAEGDTGEPVWCQAACSLVGSSFEPLEVEAADACKKIIRQWTVIDWCTWEANGSNSDDENDTDADSFQAVDDEWLGAGEWYTDSRSTAGAECAQCDKTNATSDYVYFRYTDVDADGYYTFDQVIKIIDETAPVVDVDASVTVSITDGAQSKGDDYDNCNGSTVVTADVTDMCGDTDLSADGASWWIEVYNTAGALVTTKTAFGTSASMSSQAGTQGDVHTIKWQVRDGCGNIGTATTVVTFVDDKDPTPVCFRDLSTAIMANGEVEIWASDYDNGSFDNCSDVETWFLLDGDGNPTTDQENGIPTKNLLVTCDMLINYGSGETLELGLYVTDAQLNMDFCNITLNVNGALEQCEGINQTAATIAGEISTPKGLMVESATVTLSTGVVDETSVNGTYSFYNNDFANSYQVRAERDDSDKLPSDRGISAIDLILLQKHILGTQTLDNPYQLIAADIDNNGKVSALDLVDLRKYILGVYDEFPSNSSWRFVDASVELDAANPFPFPEVLTIDNISADQMDENFIGVAIGDLSGDVVANSSIASSRSAAGTLRLTADNVAVAKGDLVEIAVAANNFDAIAGYQFTMDLNGLEFVGSAAGALDVTDANFAVLDNNTVTTAWYSAEAVSTTDALFTLTFKATADVTLNDAFAITSKVTEAVAYNGNNERLNVGMEFNVASTGFALLQNTPNPFVDATIIEFDLPEAGAATLTVFDVTGKTLKVIDGEYSAGRSQLRLTKSELGATGVVYYQLESGDFTATQKMVIID